jgi:hypothetical protein
VKNGENEMTFGAVDIPTRGIDDLRKTLRNHESKLGAAKKQRDTILIDMRKASTAADLGDQRARLELNALHKSDAAVGRLVLSAEAQVFEAEKRLQMAENQAAVAASKRASADEPLLRDKLFEVICPDGRKVRHRHSSLEALQKALQPGYVAVGQVFGANEDDTGGIVSRPGAPSMMKALLESQGDDLIEWLTARGIKATAA